MTTINIMSLLNKHWLVSELSPKYIALYGIGGLYRDLPLIPYNGTSHKDISPILVLYMIKRFRGKAFRALQIFINHECFPTENFPAS